jgi:hypothetical protein
VLYITSSTSGEETTYTMVNDNNLLGNFPTSSFKEILTVSENDGVDTWGCYNASLSSMKCRTITFAVVFLFYYFKLSFIIIKIWIFFKKKIIYNFIIILIILNYIIILFIYLFLFIYI